MSVSGTAKRLDERVHTLDGLRGVAACLVALYHFSHPLAPAGYIAVDLFFIMSGYVIAQAYTVRLERGLGAPDFLRMRLLRLYPLYAVGLVLGLVVTTLLGLLPLKQTLASLAANSLMLPAPLLHGGYLYPFNPASWSLFFELVINLAFALWMFKARSWTLTLIMLAAAIVMVPIAPGHYNLNVGFRILPEQIIGATARVCFSFSAGILVYRWQQGRVRTGSWLAVVLLLLTVAVLMLSVPTSCQAGRDLLLVLIVSPLLVIVGVRIDPPASLLPVFRYLGDISYALYAVHMAVVNAWLLWRPGDDHTAASSIIAYLLLIIVLATGLEHFFDKPVRLYLARRRRIATSAIPQSV
ncbi:acyltransferase [Novosphingobium sp. 9U]|uniref:acyltransferase family protein n=1 Tax=Novosphingobium sp. 9U TaxID=2653158 RepID=UPI0012F149E7|nr:acyltransferase [Novosphingobium sp. 9U]VWX51952.1 conserved membrane hypothetical protein [Novosphingobium sp. 9U]